MVDFSDECLAPPCKAPMACDDFGDCLQKSYNRHTPIELMDLRDKVQFLLDHFVDTPKGTFTFPDGDTWKCEKS